MKTWAKRSIGIMLVSLLAGCYFHNRDNGDVNRSERGQQRNNSHHDRDDDRQIGDHRRHRDKDSQRHSRD